MKYKVIIFVAFSLLISFSSCKFQKILKSGSVDEKYESAVKLYTKKDYSRALQLFDQISGAMRATDKAQKISYYYAYCYYNQGDYTLGSYYFKRYASNYPNTEEAEECMFMSAYCNFLNSPEFSLDQTITYDALKDLQLFINTYPTSKRVSECNDLIDKLRIKLEMKDYKIAKLYHRMDDYAASVTVMNNIIKDFPETPHKEEILYLMVKTYYQFAKESIFEKQKERYNKTIVACNELFSQYPESKYIAEANDLKEKSIKELHSISINEQNDTNRGRIKIQY
jgi:outer membrane protein assembly factor BamD